MPSTGTPSFSSLGSAAGASASYTDEGPPERMRPSGFSARISAIGAVQGSTTEKTFSSRIRRAISCVYCEPKSRMTIVWVSTLQVWQGHGRDVKNEGRVCGIDSNWIGKKDH